MDLSTIKRKLDTGQYQEPWQYVDDVWLMFNNAWLYNRKTSRVYKYCSKLAEVFEAEINPVMQGLGYCCGRKVGVGGRGGGEGSGGVGVWLGECAGGPMHNHRADFTVSSTGP